MGPPGQVAAEAPAIAPGRERVPERLFGLLGLCLEAKP